MSAQRMLKQLRLPISLGKMYELISVAYRLERTSTKQSSQNANAHTPNPEYWECVPFLVHRVVL